MAEILSLKTTYLERQDPAQAEMSYQQEIDTLFIRLDPFGGLHVACYLDDGVYALYDPETREVVGFQVENWEKTFLNVLHTDLKRYWPLPSDPDKDKGYIMQLVREYTPDACMT
jgi:hypothetical protein